MKYKKILTYFIAIIFIVTPTYVHAVSIGDIHIQLLKLIETVLQLRQQLFELQQIKSIIRVDKVPKDNAIYKPQPLTTWHWQLTGGVDTTHGVDLYDIDLFDTPRAMIDTLHKQNKKVICYFNAGAYEPYRSDSHKFDKSILGNVMDDWEDERWLDVSQYNKFSTLILERLDLAKSKKCDGVEPDNIDGYQNNTGFNITYKEQILYNKWLAAEAHKRGLAIALKNDIDQVQELVNEYDFAINEQCFEHDECDKLKPFIQNNKAVLGVEYNISTDKFCQKAKEMRFSWMKTSLNLDSSNTKRCEIR